MGPLGARARLPARAARGDRRLRRLRPIAPPSCARRRRRRPRPRGPAGAGKVAALNAAVERAARRAARVLRRQRDLGARRAAPAGGALRRPEPSATSAGSFASMATAATNQEGLYWRYEMAVRDARVAARRESPPGNGAINAVAQRGLHRARARPGARTSRSRSSSPSGAGGRSTSRRRSREEQMAATLGGVRAQAADDRRRLGDDAPPRDALAARLPAGLRVRDLLAIGRCATRRRSCT